jgi:replication fork clamp-binding protein CrfC
MIYKGEWALTVLSAEQQMITRNHLIAYHRLMLASGDKKNAFKMADLYKKQNEQELMVSFTGHFSAGKSSMINALLDKDILPKSPIPTSANIVKITSGEGTARVYFHDGDPVEYKEPYDIEMIKEYGKDKNTIKSMELSTAEQILPAGSVIVDTPGIDAADDADRLITESFLHLADVLFYVMDYNHVQSEVNLYFLQSVQDLGIPFYIIINQVDKHDEQELSFSAFKARVNETLEQWDIRPDQVYYSSLYDQSHPYSQFNDIKKMVFSLMGRDKEHVLRVSSSAKNIVEAHKQYLQQVYDEKSADIDSDFTDADREKMYSIQEEMENLQCEPQQTEDFFRRELQTTLNNAYLMPADLRDKAAFFLESSQKNFKIGLFSSKKKIAAEKRKRTEDFLEPLQKNAESGIEWKLRDKFISGLKENEIVSPEITNKIQRLKVSYTEDDLFCLIKPGAEVNGDSILNYTNDVSNDIKKKFKDQARPLIGMIAKVVQENTDGQLKELKKQHDCLKNAHRQQQYLAEYKKELEEKIELLKMQTDCPEADDAARQMIEASIHAANPPVKTAQPHQIKQTAALTEQQVREEQETDKVPAGNGHLSIDDILPAIDRTIGTVESLPGFHTYINDLKARKQKLDNRNLTIALFGAFSAGKSSFANALLGEGLLPSSPNPTTAVINRITPVTREYAHGTVVIQLKDEETLVRDLIAITSQFSPAETNFSRLLEWVEKHRIYENGELDKLYQAYLQAMFAGYAEHKQHIGKQITISLAEFAAFVTDETKACYMESVDLYYDCSLTRLGITLVDTPGADSVNARHTNVAFDYIKYADAILYVTYYNHALSRADKDFLLQLGRVKEAFELDKMFFIINAADLAENDAELNLVVRYTEEQLLKLGIRFPKIFPVSSKQSLEDKNNSRQLNEKMTTFEDVFYQFINYDLAHLLMESAYVDIQRTYQALTGYLKTADLNVQEKQQFREKLLRKQENLTEMVEAADTDQYILRIGQKIEKQLYYVEERLAIRFHDMFKEVFNPTTVTASGKKAQKQLQRCLTKLIDDVSYEMLQELRAVSLRIESYLTELQGEAYHALKQESKQIDDSFILPGLEKPSLETPVYEAAFKEVDMTSLQQPLARFKGTKAFFVHNEKEIMKEEIYDLLAPSISIYVNGNRGKMEHVYREQWEKVMQSMKWKLNKAVADYAENNLSFMADTADIGLLRDKQRILAAVLATG